MFINRRKSTLYNASEILNNTVVPEITKTLLVFAGYGMKLGARCAVTAEGFYFSVNEEYTEEIHATTFDGFYVHNDTQISDLELEKLLCEKYFPTVALG